MATLEERLLSKVVKQENGCWEWRGAHSRGYGRIKVLGRGGGRRATAIDVLNRRLARGEIDRAEYEEKRKQIGR
jgi:uncharacterized membrane protein